MTRIGKTIISVTLFLVTPFAWSTLSVQATVDRNTVRIGDSFTISVTVGSGEEVDVEEPRVPNLDGVELVNSWTSSSISSKLIQTDQGMKFETMRMATTNYSLVPKRLGKLQIPPFDVIVGGKSYKTKPIEMQVVNQGPQNENDEPDPMGEQFESEEEALFHQLLRRRGLQPPGGGQQHIPEENIVRNPKESFFVHIEVDKKEVYEGEQITSQWYIYTRGNILSLDRLKFPDLKGFWKEIIEEVPALQFSQAILNGVPYKKALLASHALFPIKPGDITIDEYKVKASIQVPTSPFGSFGFGPTYSFTRVSPPVKVKVKPLPSEGRPANFAGAVGNFEIRSEMAQNLLTVNAPFTLKVRFEGAGNAKLIELPTVELPPELELYETKSDSRFFKNGRSFKEFEILIIPRQAGDFTIPVIAASFFDPAKGQYYQTNSIPITIKVLQGDQSKMSSNRVDTKKPEDLVQNALPPIVMSYESSSSGVPYSGKIFWLSLYSLLGLVVLLKARRELNWGQQKMTMAAELEKRMKIVRQKLKEGQFRQTSIEMTNLGYYVLGKITGLGGASVEVEKLLEVASPSIRRELGKELTQIFDQFQALSFAPEELLGKSKNTSELSQSVTRFEKILKQAIELADQAQDDG